MSDGHFSVVEDVRHILDKKRGLPSYVNKRHIFSDFRAVLREGNLSRKQKREVGWMITNNPPKNQL